MSQYTPIPTRHLRDTPVPALFLGDHGFNSKFGSTLTDDQVRLRMQYAIQRSNIGLACGDGRLLRLARDAEEAARAPLTLLYHTDIPVQGGGGRLGYGPCGSTLRACMESRQLSPLEDPVLSYLVDFDPRDALTGDRLRALTLCAAGLELLATNIATHRPSVVSVGGDWLDMLLLAGLEELAMEGLAAIGDITASFGAGLIVTLYVGAVVDFVLPRGAIGILVPFNQSGAAMLPDRATAIEWMERAGYDFLGMHLLGGAPAPRTALMKAGVATPELIVSAIVGASRPTSIAALLDAASDLWR